LINGCGDIIRFGKLVSAEPEMIKIFKLIEGIAPTDATILVLGESGTGKELIAEAIHERSKRVGKPFVALNCSAIPDELIESQLFGHVRGAFTGASMNLTGKFEAASGGTLFLDEIGDMSLKMQSKILRALETREIQPVGSNKNIKVDVRVIAATNKNLEEAVMKKEFRSDLFFRLNEVIMKMPPLRERQNDLHLILWDMVEEYNKEFNKNVEAISLSALGLLQKHTWPGNIRELRNVVKRMMLLIGENTAQIFAEYLPVQLIDDDKSNAGAKLIKEATENIFQSIISDDISDIAKKTPGELPSLETIECKYIDFVLKSVKNNKSKAAQILKIDRTTLYEKIRKFDIR